MLENSENSWFLGYKHPVRTALPLPLLTEELSSMSAFTLCLCDIVPPVSPSSPPHVMTCGGPSASSRGSCVACVSSRGGRTWFSSSSRSSKERLCSELWRRRTLKWINNGPRASKAALCKWFLRCYSPLPGRTGPRNHSRLRCLSHWPGDWDRTHPRWDLRSVQRAQKRKQYSSGSPCIV